MTEKKLNAYRRDKKTEKELSVNLYLSYNVKAMGIKDIQKNV